MGLTTQDVVYAQDFRDISSTKELQIGARGVTRDGRQYRYALNGAVALDPGKIVTAANAVANHVNVVVAAAVSVGATQVTATLGATAATANQYQDGYMTVNDVTGEGINYLINGHAAVASAGVITANLVDPVKVALTTSSEVTFMPNQYGGVIASQADQLDMVVGVPNVTVTIAYYAWVQTVGMCSVLSDETVAKGQALTCGSSVVGAVEAADAAGEQIIGYAAEDLVDTEYHSIVLCIE